MLQEDSAERSDARKARAHGDEFDFVVGGLEQLSSKLDAKGIYIIIEWAMHLIVQELADVCSIRTECLG